LFLFCLYGLFLSCNLLIGSYSLLTGKSCGYSSSSVSLAPCIHKVIRSTRRTRPATQGHRVFYRDEASGTRTPTGASAKGAQIQNSEPKKRPHSIPHGGTGRHVRPGPVLSYSPLPSPVLSCPVLSCPVLSSPVLSCPVTSCPVLSCLVLSCHVLSCPVLSCHGI
jgi:hypothetical protein